jgi:hypothetical protein
MPRQLDRRVLTRKRHAGANGAMNAYRSKALASRALAGAMIWCGRAREPEIGQS